VAQVKLVSQAEYARHRGVSEAAVSKAVSQRRITLTPDGLIDPLAADAQWARNTRVRAGSGQSGGAALGAAPGAVSAPVAGRSGALADAAAGVAALESAARGRELEVDKKPGDDDYWQSRGRREKAEAERSELELGKLKGELIEVSAVRGQIGAVLSSLREALMQIPARMSPVLAAEADASRVHEALSGEIHQALEQFTTLATRMEAKA
jgi:hypothetical protein